MLYRYPAQTFGRVIRGYKRPYENPIVVRAGDLVRPIADGSKTTDIPGWTWCVGPDGRSGWTPDNWCEPRGDRWRLKRDFSALELTVEVGDRLHLLLSESGFLIAETEDGDRAWVPDAVIELEGPLSTYLSKSLTVRNGV
ncbi:SH3 domain-containing protein [Altericroceibacterium xinjiangense]|uniref:SH3 domain-containing protein n=1 Tax=Altericroceibacterium xinjiangense TaxID=762261 RepID=UPI000F7F067E